MPVFLDKIAIEKKNTRNEQEEEEEGHKTSLFQSLGLLFEFEGQLFLFYFSLLLYAPFFGGVVYLSLFCLFSLSVSCFRRTQFRIYDRFLLLGSIFFFF